MPSTNPLWLISQAPQDLKAQIRIAVGHGYHVTSQTEKTVQLVRPKRFSIGAALLWLFVFGFGIILYFIYYLSKSDEAIYLDLETQPSVEELAKLPRQKQQSIGMKFLIGFGAFMFLCFVVTGATLLATKGTPQAPVKVLSPEEQAQVLKDRLTKDLAQAKAYKADASSLSGSSDVKAAEDIFDTWGVDVANGRASKDADVVKLANDLAKQASRIQVIMFPLMRKTFANTASDKLWSTNGEVRVAGARNDIIIFTSATFASNTNASEAFEAIKSALFRLRFTDARFEWYRGSEYVHWDNLTSTKDADVVAEVR